MARKRPMVGAERVLLTSVEFYGELDVDDSGIESNATVGSQLHELAQEQEIDGIPYEEKLQEVKRSLRTVIGAIFWLNARSSATKQHARRRPQEERRASLKQDPFSGAFVDYAAKEDDEEPSFTAGHTEQSLIVSDQWAGLRDQLTKLLNEYHQDVIALREAWQNQLDPHDEDPGPGAS